MAILKDLIVQGSSRHIGPAYAGTIYAESFVKDGSDSSYVLLGDGSHMDLSSLNSSHTHYIGTTQVQNSSAAQGLTGITSIASPASTALYISPASTLYLDSAAGNSILFRKGTTEIARFNTSGNLCIGTTSPNDNTAYKLDVGGSIRSSGGTMTGAINRIYDSASDDPVLNVASNNQDIWLWRVKDAGSGTPTDVDKVWGFGAKYLGSGTGNNNSWAMYADNQNGAYIKALEMKQSGDLFAYAPIHWTSNALPSATSLDYILGINAFASGGTTKYIKLSDLKTSLGMPTVNDGILKVQANDTTATNLFTANQSGNSTLKFSNGTNILITNSSNTISIAHATPSSGTAISGTSTTITPNSTKIIQNISIAKDSQGHITSLTYTYGTMPSIPAAPGTLNTNNANAQTVSSNEALSGTINLHKVSKTGTFSDLIGAPVMTDYVTKADYQTLNIVGSSHNVYGYNIQIIDSSSVDSDVYIPPMSATTFGVAKAKGGANGTKYVGIDSSGYLTYEQPDVSGFIDQSALNSALNGFVSSYSYLGSYTIAKAGLKISAGFEVTYDNGTLTNSSSSYGDIYVPIGGAGQLGVVKSGTSTGQAAINSNGIITYSDTKCTSVSNHYLPTVNSNSKLTATAGTGKAISSITLNRDAKGHVISITKDEVTVSGTGGGSAENCVTYTSENNGVRTISVVNALPSSPNENTLYIIL